MPPTASKISPLTASTALRTPLPPIARLVAVAQLDRLVRAGRGAGGHGGAAARAVLQHDIDFDGRIAAAVEDFAADDVDDGGHGLVPGCSAAFLQAGNAPLSCPAPAEAMAEAAWPRKPLQLGRPIAACPPRPTRRVLDRVPNPHPDTNYVARFTAPEFTCLCPVTGQPDFAHLVIDYVPGRWLVESKSLKLYLDSFRNHGAFHEDCTVAIGKRLAALLKPKWLRIGGYWYPRGGMPIDVFWQTGKLPEGRLGAGPGRRALSRRAARRRTAFADAVPQPVRADQADRDQHRGADPQHRRSKCRRWQRPAP